MDLGLTKLMFTRAAHYQLCYRGLFDTAERVWEAIQGSWARLSRPRRGPPAGAAQDPSSRAPESFFGIDPSYKRMTKVPGTIRLLFECQNRLRSPLPAQASQ